MTGGLLHLPVREMLQDGTLLTTRSRARFARGAGDWQFLTPQVPAVLQQLVQDGYRIVVFR